MEKLINEEWLNNIIKKGINYRASDIHFENFENFIQIRYRIDGILTNKLSFKFTREQIDSFIIKIKLMSNMNITEKRKPQDGKINNFECLNKKYDIRVSSVCTIYGEKIVMRLSETQKKIDDFKTLGFNEENEIIMKKLLKNKSGIIYLGGTTGSGKTTTLYSMINYLNSENINIYTIENPVEKNIKNINQIQINELAGIDYVSTVKALLRQDPDIIVISEIRDSETAKIALKASLTGHLVITTIHSNNSIDCISRLIDMNVEPYLLSASSLGFLSQTLVKRLCPKCKKKILKLKEYQKIWIDKIIKNYNLKDFNINNYDIYEPVGCENCINGFKDRIALTEILTCNKNIQNIICESKNLNKINEAAINNNFKSIYLDGFYKIINGITSLDEVITQLNAYD